MMQFWWTFITTLHIILLTFPWVSHEKSIIFPSSFWAFTFCKSYARSTGWMLLLLHSLLKEKNKNLTWSKFKFINHTTSKSIQSALRSDRDPAWLLLGSQDLKEHLSPEAQKAQWGALSSPIQKEPTSTHRHGNTLTLQVLLLRKI